MYFSRSGASICSTTAAKTGHWSDNTKRAFTQHWPEYFQDPDGHRLEVLQFPPGKVDPKWRAGGGFGGCKKSSSFGETNCRLGTPIPSEPGRVDS